MDDSSDLSCECGTEPHTMQHLLEGPLLKQICTARDLTAYNQAHMILLINASSTA